MTKLQKHLYYIFFREAPTIHDILNQKDDEWLQDGKRQHEG